MRSAGVLVTRALHDREAAVVEDVAQAGQPRVEAKRTSAAVGAYLQHLPRRDRDRRTTAVVERVLVRHERAQRVVSAIQVDDHEAARARPLRTREVAKKRGRCETDGERRNTAADEFPA
jgi:hypothetical protein